MWRLAATPDLDIRLKHDFRDLTRRIPDVGEVVLRDELFRSVQIHRNNADYGFLLDICRLLSRHLSPEAGTGNVRFRDFTATDTEMGLLFEEFVRSFLSIEHSDLRVSRGNWEIKWNEVRATDAKRFPVLKTDIHVPSAGGRSAIVETKCESKPFAGAVESSDDSLKSRHLYQLFAYLTNHAHSNSGEPPALGVLLYATVGETFDYRYSVRSHPLWVRSIDLSKPWPKVREDLNCLAADLAGQTRSGMATAA